MKLLASTVLLLFALAAYAQSDSAWLRIAPRGEEFSVLMPTQAQRTLAALEFPDENNVATPVYISKQGAKHFIIFSFGKDEAPLEAYTKSRETFIKAFAYAVKHANGKSNKFTAIKSSTGDATSARFQINVGDTSGAARIFETAKFYYVAIELGTNVPDELSTRFFDSFTLVTTASDATQTNVMLAAADANLVGWTKINPASAKRDAPSTSQTTERGSDEQNVPAQQNAAAQQNIVANDAEQNTDPVLARSRAFGQVNVEVVIDEKGKVISAKAISGPTTLREAAEKAAPGWRFAPTIYRGEAVKVKGIIIFNFTRQ